MIFRATNIYKSYGSLKALSEVNLECKKGEICGLIGANGAGKSTLFKIILGLIKQDSGTIEIDSFGLKPIGGIIEKPALYEYLTAYGNLKVFSQVQGLNLSTALYKEIMVQVGLHPERKDIVKNYSLGMKQRLGLAIALLNKPDCLVLDEPFSGLDPMGIHGFHKLIKKLSIENKITILISSHIVGELAELCDTLYVLNKGRMIRSGQADELYNTSVSSFKILGSGFQKVDFFNALNPVEIQGGYLVTTNRTKISSIIKEMAIQGAEITACIPQTDLKVLFDDECL
ncbi:MAG: ABC transporter ATP-binding protein [Eudoraea sp.]|uniref:ABC transporter ATP-binding protein n=1 Tax=Eudoraea sp. TaxID=1979955 RepID=UPI003C742E00